MRPTKILIMSPCVQHVTEAIPSLVLLIFDILKFNFDCLTTLPLNLVSMTDNTSNDFSYSNFYFTFKQVLWRQIRTITRFVAHSSVNKFVHLIRTSQYRHFNKYYTIGRLVHFSLDLILKRNFNSFDTSVYFIETPT